jgi:hypothetical protein
LNGLMIASIFFIAFRLPAPLGHGRRWNRAFVSRSRAKARKALKNEGRSGRYGAIPNRTQRLDKGLRCQTEHIAHYRAKWSPLQGRGSSKRVAVVVLDAS